MNDDYLWDRSGEPDKEIQRLEGLLGTLRYEPRPLAIPAAPAIGHRHSFIPTLAIAATIALMVLAAGVWFAVNRKTTVAPGEATMRPVQPKVGDKPMANAAPSPKENATSTHDHALAATPYPAHRHTLAVGLRRQTNRPVPASDISAGEMAVAKDQLLLALRVASLKLNLAQRRTQTATPPPTQIRNQHRIG
jgi:hypothetical protein